LPPYAPTIPNALREAVSTFGSEEFLIGPDRRLTFRDADDASAALAQGLLALGIGKGSRVGILMPNSVDWVLCWLAAARIGALTVPISTLYQGPELRRLLDHADVEVLLAVDGYMKHDYVGRLEEYCGLEGHDDPRLALSNLPYLRRVVVWGRPTPPWAWHGPDQLLHPGSGPVDRSLVAEAEAKVVPADDLVIVYTSGSTAEPKAVVHTHAGVVRLCHMLLTLGWSDVRHGDRIYSAVPFFWIGGLNSTVVPAIMRGASVVTTGTPDIDEVIEACAREDVTGINAWNTQLGAIEERIASGEVVLPHYRSRRLEVDAAGEVIPHALIPNPLGMTETFGPHGAAPRGTRLPADKAGACGPSLPGIDRKVVDPETGRECGADEPGELYVRGFSVMRCFYKRLPEETFDRDGFYPTGDRCRVDADGYLYFESRFGEMIKTRGANVAPREVELALEADPSVREAIVFGLPDPTQGEAIVAVVVPVSDAIVDPQLLRDGLKDQLSHYKVPHHVFAMADEEIPRTHTNKVRKHLLAERIARRIEDQRAVASGS
jgi:acyl-coenzyme A synthetase/AMP-(fatty) acid ligase